MAESKEETYELRQFEDSNLTKFLFEQTTIINFSQTFLGITSILLSFSEAFVGFQDGDRDLLLAVQSVISILLVTLVLLKHFKMLTLKQKQLIRDKKENKCILAFRSTWLEIIVLLFHPNMLFEGIVLQVQ